MRFQGGTLFPAVVIGVLVLGLVTIAYARESRPDAGSFPPQIGDHWHAAVGVYVCDGFLPKIAGDAEETVTDASGQSYVNDLFGTTGVHSHDDGVIHWHPFTAKSIGRRAKLGLYLDVYDIGLSADRLSLPDAQGGTTYDADDFKCDGKDVDIKVVTWANNAEVGSGTTYTTDLGDVGLSNDGMIYTIAVVAAGVEVGMPPWAADLQELGAADGGNVPTPGSTPGVTAVPGNTSPTGSTSPAGSTSPTGSTSPAGSTEPAPSTTAG